MAAPKKKIDWNIVDEYLQAQCNGTGIADLLGIHPDTLYLRCQEEHNMGFSEYSAKKKGEGKVILTKDMWDLARSGDRVMQIWLSKQYLGFTDKTDVDLTEHRNVVLDAFGVVEEKANEPD